MDASLKFPIYFLKVYSKGGCLFGDDLPMMGGGKANGPQRQAGGKIRMRSRERVDRQPSVFFGTI
jgi:hypothetical protein